MDHNIIRPKDGKKFPSDIYDWELMPGMLPVILKYQMRGFIPIIVSNQGCAIEQGYATKAEIEEKLDTIVDILEEVYHLDIGGVYYSEKHDPADPMRKPNPGMANKARRELGIDLVNSIMVGDMKSDEEFAINAGIGTFFYTDEFINHLNK